MTVLSDNRKYQAMSVEDADALFLKIARLRATLEKETAKQKDAAARLEQAFRDRIADTAAAKEALEAELTAYILANPDRFKKPRKHPVGQIGTYGITTDPAFVVVDDPETFLEFAMTNGYDDCMIVKRSVDRVAAMKRIAAGEDLPGVHTVPAGDVAKIAFKKDYADYLEEA